MTNNSELINKVYDKIHSENIKLFEVTDMGNLKGVTIKDNEYNVYGIFCPKDGFNDKDEEFCVLAHELGHCLSGATHALNSPYELIERHEYRANRAAIHEFLTVDRIIEAINNNCSELWQIAEYIDIPEKFVSQAIKLYKIEGKL